MKYQMNEQLKSDLISRFPSLFDSKGRVNTNLMRSSKSSLIIEQMMSEYSLELTRPYLLSQRLVMLFNDIDKSSHRCEICGNPTSLDTVNKVFRRWCSLKCVHASEDVRKKTRSTCQKRYGHSTNLALPSARASYLEKYGGYGMASTKIRKKVEDTVMERYGVTNVYQSQHVIDKIKDSHHAKYSGKMYSQQHISDEVMRKLNDKDYCQMIVDEKVKTFTEHAGEIGVTVSTLLRYIGQHGIAYTRKCTSIIETTIDNWLDEMGIIHTRNDRSVLPNMEVDIYIPEHKIAIELNGVYWHSDSNINDRHYHFKKSKAANDHGIQLLSFWEHETVSNLEVVKSMILNKCHISNRIFARHCLISPITSDQRRAFFDDNHLSGDEIADASWGLFNNEVLVAAVSMKKSRLMDGSWEIVCYANILNTTVVGGFSKLFSHAVNELNMESCVAYAKGQISQTGNVYLRAGFTYDSLSSPGYFYFRNGNNGITIVNRDDFKQMKLGDLLYNYDTAKSDHENMISNRWHRIWDMGNHKLRWTR